jgi:hypothetical protein
MEGFTAHIEKIHTIPITSRTVDLDSFTIHIQEFAFFLSQYTSRTIIVPQLATFCTRIIQIRILINQTLDKIQEITDEADVKFLQKNVHTHINSIFTHTSKINTRDI